MPNYLPELHREVEVFLYHEAKLLDELRFEEWLALFTDDASYWSPITETLEADDSRDPASGEWAFVEERKSFMVKRNERLKSGMAYSEQPRSRTRHFVSNVLVSPDAGVAVIAHSNILVFQSRRDKSETFFVGRRQDQLVRSGADWKIAERKVFLDHRVLPRALSIFL